MKTPVACSLIHIVDDDEAVRRAISFLIESRGGRVCVYESAEAFVRQLNALQLHEPSGLVLDLHLGGRNGAELLEQLQIEKRPLPTVVLTAHPESPLAARALKAGALRIIRKPFRAADLFEALDEALPAPHPLRGSPHS